MKKVGITNNSLGPRYRRLWHPRSQYTLTYSFNRFLVYSNISQKFCGHVATSHLVVRGIACQIAGIMKPGGCHDHKMIPFTKLIMGGYLFCVGTTIWVCDRL
jgi:hypothetical protein